MKHYLSRTLFVALTLTLTVALAAAGCGKGKDKDKGTSGGKDKTQQAAPGGGAAAPAPAAAPKLALLDASAAGEAYKGWKLMAPEGATAKEDFGALAVAAGAGFQLEVHSGAVDMAARKKEIESNDVNKLKRYVTDTPEAIVFESDVGMGKPEFHFLAAIKVGGEDFSCENTKGPIYTQAQIEAMLQACKSLKK